MEHALIVRLPAVLLLLRVHFMLGVDARTNVDDARLDGDALVHFGNVDDELVPATAGRGPTPRSISSGACVLNSSRGSSAADFSRT